MTYRPPLSGKARPHMLLPTEDKLNSVCSLLVLLIKLDVINNTESLFTPALSTNGETYYHK